jgi:hypothetical protein
MSKGILIFAFNNESFDYLAMAAWSAKNIHRHLNVPVCVVTNADNIPDNYEFDHVVSAKPQSSNYRVFGDLNVQGRADAWYNSNRVDAYSLTPFDQTIVLDADYVVASNQLGVLFESPENFLSFSYAYDVTNRNPFTDHNAFGKNAMPMWWATAMYFRKSETAQLMFDCMLMIRQNWNHYRQIYGINKPEYRNDHALTIALGIVDGHKIGHCGIPWALPTVLPGPRLTQLDQDSYKLEYITAEKQNRYLILNDYDFHVLGKFQLGEMIANSQ